MTLFGQVSSTAAADEATSDLARVQAGLDAEAALAGEPLDRALASHARTPTPAVTR